MPEVSKPTEGNGLTVQWNAEDWGDILALQEQMQATSVGRVTATDVVRLGLRELAQRRLPGRAA